MTNLSNLINGNIFAENSQALMKVFLEIIFSWRFLIVIILFFSIKYLWYFIKSHAVILLKKKVKFYKKIQTISVPIQEDIKNIFYGWIGVFFSWTIVIFFSRILPLWMYKISWLNNYSDVVISTQQIEFAKIIHQFMGYLELIEVMLILGAFLMLIFSFLWWVFKTASKLTGAIAIILYTWSIFISSYAALLLAITNKN